MFENIEVVDRRDLFQRLSKTEVSSELNNREKQKVHHVTETHFKDKLIEGTPRANNFLGTNQKHTKNPHFRKKILIKYSL